MDGFDFFSLPLCFTLNIKQHAMLKRFRTILAILSFTLLTLLFLDFTGSLHRWFGWLAKVQLLPAVLAGNILAISIIAILTLLFGRVYCSVICPLGIMQDGIARLKRKRRYSHSKALNRLRYSMLALLLLALLVSIRPLVALLDPYSAYGRIAQSLLAPLWAWANNGLAYLAERANSYAFYSVDVWLKGGVTLAVAVATLLIVSILAWRNGRTYCNTICPVGTVLGLISRFAIFRIRMDAQRCTGCGQCAKNCKASCIDVKNKQIDHSRCVACMNCLGKCKFDAISYGRAKATAQAPSAEGNGDSISRRKFLTVSALLGSSVALRAQEKTVDGGLATIIDKQAPRRTAHLVPPGAQGHRNMNTRCTACQLCVSACPNHVLRPATDLQRLMQPEMSYERGYCRPECNRCSQVCPAGAIKPTSLANKSATQIGHAVWLRDNCVVLTDGVSCGNCARHCPTGAISMVTMDESNPDSPLIPAVNTERCIGCGACENLCPARPFSAIYVEGHEMHREI